ncbi:MAG: hypothetical protein RR945_11345 [Erysipelotrichaceae bacterium]
MRFQVDANVTEHDFETHYRDNMKKNSKVIILVLNLICLGIGFFGAKLLAKDGEFLNVPVLIVLTFIDLAVVYFIFSTYSKQMLQKAIVNGICDSLSQSYIFYDTYFTTSKGNEAIFYKDIVELSERNDLLLLRYLNVFFLLPLRDMSYEERTLIEQLIRKEGQL